MEIRKAQKEDIGGIEAIYERIHDEEERGLATIGWIRGVYPTRATAQSALARGDLFVLTEDGRVAAADQGFGQSQLLCVIDQRVDDRRRHGIRKPDILRRDDQKSSAGRQKISRLQKARKIKERRIFVRAADRFLKRRQKVVMLVSVAVELQDKIADRLIRRFFGEVSARSEEADLQSADRAAHIARRRSGENRQRLFAFGRLFGFVFFL